MTLNEIGAESLKTSAEKGFGVIRPEDWSKKLTVEELAGEWDFEPAHVVTGDFDGSKWWRVFAMRKEDHRCIVGTGGTAEEAQDNCLHNIFTDPQACYMIPTKIALIHSEVSEALEEFRKGHDLQKFGGELADIIIRVGQLGVGLGIDVDAAVEAKLAANREREFQHGGRLI